ncbi:uncharacterized protein LOC128207337 [Mya arenaria]|nr:uncharacterized protein LOC128207337 [Mya arenaria]
MSTLDPQAASAAGAIKTVSFTENDLEIEDIPLNHITGENPTRNYYKEIPTIVIDTTDENKDDEPVTLHRKDARFCEPAMAEAVTDDDFRYSKYLQPQSTFHRKEMLGSEKMISDEELRFASTLVHDAMEGRTVDIKTEARYVRSYNLYKGWPLTYLLYVAISINLSLVIFEEPADPALSLPIHVTMPVEALCLIYFIIRTVHHYHWRRTSRFFRDLKNICIIAIIALIVVDMIVYLIWLRAVPNGHHVRFSRILRPLVLVNFSDGRQIRRAWRNMRRTIKEIIHVIVLFYFFIFVFAVIALQIFSSRSDMQFPDGRPYFKTYFECVWELYVLVTTSNNPDVTIPALTKSRFYCIFFSVYIVVCFYMLLNVFLAVAYHSYNENMKNEIRRSSREKKKKLGQAFDVIKIDHNGMEMVTYRTWKRLMGLAKPGLSKNQVDLLMLILDMDRSGHIGRREFMNVADLLNVPVSEVEDRITWLEKVVPQLYNSRPSEYLRSFVDSVFFKLMYDIIVLIEIFLIGFAVEGESVPFCLLFSIEILLKVYTFGPKQYFRDSSNWFDVAITSLALVFLVIGSAYSPKDQTSVVVLREISQTVKVMRIFRILRLLVQIQRFKIITNTLVNISLAILMYCGILFIIFYIFAIIGLELFKGRIKTFNSIPTNTTDPSLLYCGNEVLKDSAFHESNYCYLNFNDIGSATLVLCTILFDNNWDIVTNGFVLVTNKATRAYFAIFYACVTVVVMNIMTAFIVDMFMYEYTIQKDGKVDSTVEKKIKELGLGIDAETGLEISQPMSDEQMSELMEGNNIKLPPVHPWIEKSTPRGFRNAEIRFSTFSSYVNKRKSSIPTLNKFDGIRFHIKKKGWTKIEVLLQQLYDGEGDVDTTIDFKDRSEENKAKTMLA